jgi:allantoicase
MAAGVQQQSIKGRFVTNGILLDGAQSTTSGQWFFINGNHPLTVTIEGTFSATVQIMLSNAQSQPAAATDGPVLGGNLTTMSSQTIDAPYRWVKVKVTVYASGTINAFVYGG